MSTPLEIAVEMHLQGRMTLKPPLHFYLLVEKPLGCYFQIWSPYYQVEQCNQKTPIPHILKVTGQVWEIQKRTSINTYTQTCYLGVSENAVKVIGQSKASHN